MTVQQLRGKFRATPPGSRTCVGATSRSWSSWRRRCARIATAAGAAQAGLDRGATQVLGGGHDRGDEEEDAQEREAELDTHDVCLSAAYDLAANKSKVEI
jgi:hypothetical protein